MPTLNDRIRRARALSGVTQSTLARKVGVHRSAVAQWESPIGSTPSMEHLIAIALHTCVNLEWLGTGRGNPLAVNEAIDHDHDDDRHGRAGSTVPAGLAAHAETFARAGRGGAGGGRPLTSAAQAALPWRLRAHPAPTPQEPHAAENR